MLRSFFICLLVVILAVPAWSLSPARAAWPVWFEQLKQKIDDCGLNISDEERQQINNHLKMKPTGDTGRFYSDWFMQGFRWKFDDVGPSLTSTEAEVLEWLLQGRPSGPSSRPFYKEYLGFFRLTLADNFLPVIDPTEKKLADYLVRACPDKRSEASYEVWMKTWSELEKQFGNLNDGEKFVLEMLREIQPDLDPANGEVYKVSGDTLLKIRRLILDGQSGAAVRELDQIMGF